MAGKNRNRARERAAINRDAPFWCRRRKKRHRDAMRLREAERAIASRIGKATRYPSGKRPVRLR